MGAQSQNYHYLDGNYHNLEQCFSLLLQGDSIGLKISERGFFFILSGVWGGNLDILIIFMYCTIFYKI